LKIIDIRVDPVDRKQVIDRVRGFLGGNKPYSSTGPGKQPTKSRRKNANGNTRGFAQPDGQMGICRKQKCPTLSGASIIPVPPVFAFRVMMMKAQSVRDG